MANFQEFVSDFSGKSFPITERISAQTIRKSIFNLIVQENPNFFRDSFIAIPELNLFRSRYIENSLIQELGELTTLEQNVMDSLNKRTPVSDLIHSDEYHQELKLGQRVADKVANFGGSWTFIISFAVFLGVWIAVNVTFLANQGFDPYPFILLNLILSCLAALQAPIIMMSQNRQEEKDRERAQKDYMVNLKAELEIRMLHEKIDHLIMHQQQELLELQKIQIEMMNDILKQVNESHES